MQVILELKKFTSKFVKKWIPSGRVNKQFVWRMSLRSWIHLFDERQKGKIEKWGQIEKEWIPSFERVVSPYKKLTCTILQEYIQVYCMLPWRSPARRMDKAYWRMYCRSTLGINCSCRFNSNLQGCRAFQFQ